MAGTTGFSRSSSSLPKRPRLGARLQLELSFNTEDDKQAFLTRWDRAKRFLASETSLPLGNKELLSLLLDKAEANLEGTATPSPESGADSGKDKGPAVPILDNSGKFDTLPSIHLCTVFALWVRVLHWLRGFQ